MFVYVVFGLFSIIGRVNFRWLHRLLVADINVLVTKFVPPTSKNFEGLPIFYIFLNFAGLCDIALRWMFLRVNSAKVVTGNLRNFQKKLRVKI